MPTPTGVTAYDTAALASEMQRQADFGPVNLQDNTGRPGFVSVPAPPLTAAAARQADINHYRRLRAIAIANGLSPTSAIQALQSLGTGGA